MLYTADNYAKLYATREGHPPVQRVWPFATGTESEATAWQCVAEARQFHRSNGYRVRLSVWRQTQASRTLRGVGLVGEGIGALAREPGSKGSGEGSEAAE